MHKGKRGTPCSPLPPCSCLCVSAHSFVHVWTLAQIQQCSATMNVSREGERRIRLSISGLGLRPPFFFSSFNALNPDVTLCMPILSSIEKEFAVHGVCILSFNWYGEWSLLSAHTSLWQKLRGVYSLVKVLQSGVSKDWFFYCYRAASGTSAACELAWKYGQSAHLKFCVLN